MTIYIVRNERNEEVSAYTDLQRASYLAEELQDVTLRPHSVEELDFDSENVEY